MPKKKVAGPEPVEEKESKKVVVVEEVEDAPKEEPTTTDLPADETEAVGEKEVEQVEKVEEEESEKPKVGKLLWIIIPTTLLVGALVGGIITYFSGLPLQEEVETTPSPIATVEPVKEEDTKETETNLDLKREDLKVQVLNGSGVAGSAGKAKEFLEDLGYKDVAVGNAKTSDFEETEISITEDKKDYLELLTKDLEGEYSLATETATLSGSSSYDVVITLGSK